MSHNLMEINGEHAMYMVGDRDAAWHKLGQRCPEAVSWAEAMELARLNWLVEKRQLFGKGSQLAIEDGQLDSSDSLSCGHFPIDAWGIFRADGSDKFLGAVGAKYTPIQNKDAFEFVDVLLEAANGAHYDSAGALGEGERIWCSAKVPFDFEPVPGDKHETYLMFTTSHDGQTSAMCKLTTVRVVCQNTLTAAIADSGAMVRIRHTASAGERLGRAAILMQGVGHDVAALDAKLTLLAGMEIRAEQVERVFERLFPIPAAMSTESKRAASSRRANIVDTVRQLYTHNDGGQIAGIAGTGYNLLNSLTEYADHFRSVRGGNGQPERVLAARAESSMFGSGELFKREALQAVMEVCQSS